MSNINSCDCKEHWMEIKNINGSKYLLSSKGRLYNFKLRRFISSTTRQGYIKSSEYFFSDKVHRMVYRYFNQICKKNSK